MYHTSFLWYVSLRYYRVTILLQFGFHYVMFPFRWYCWIFLLHYNYVIILLRSQFVSVALFLPIFGSITLFFKLLFFAFPLRYWCVTLEFFNNRLQFNFCYVVFQFRFLFVRFPLSLRYVNVSFLLGYFYVTISCFWLCFFQIFGSVFVMISIEFILRIRIRFCYVMISLRLCFCYVFV